MSSKPELFFHVRYRRWTNAIDRARTHPEETRFVDSNGDTILHWAASASDPPIAAINALVKCYPEATTAINTDKGRTPLHNASYNSSVAVIKALLKENTTPCDITDSSGFKPLELLRMKYFLAIREALSDPLLPEESPSVLYTRVTPLREFIDKAVPLLKAAYHHSIDEPLPDGKAWRVVHASMAMKFSVGTPFCPSDVMSLTMKLHPEQVREADEEGNLPLHVFVATPLIPTGMSSRGSTIMALLNGYRAAAKVRNKKGKLPLQLVIDTGTKWDDGVKRVLDAFPDAITKRDNTTGLFPFMTAASMGNTSSLTTVYRLLRFYPEMQQFMGSQGEVQVGAREGKDHNGRKGNNDKGLDETSGKQPDVDVIRDHLQDQESALDELSRDAKRQKMV